VNKDVVTKKKERRSLMKRHIYFFLLVSLILCSGALTPAKAESGSIKSFQSTDNPLSLIASDSDLLSETPPESALSPESFNPFIISTEFLYMELGFLPWNAVTPYINALHWAEINGNEEAIAENLYAISAIVEYGTVESMRSGLPIMALWTDRQIALIQEAIDAGVIRDRTRVSAALFFAYMNGGFLAPESFFIFQIYQLRLDRVLVYYIELGHVGVERYIVDALIAFGMSPAEALEAASIIAGELLDFLDGFEDGVRGEGPKQGQDPSYYIGYYLGKWLSQAWKWLKEKLSDDGSSGDPTPIIWPGPLWGVMTFQGASLTYSIGPHGELYFEMDTGIDLEAELGFPSGTIPDMDPAFLPGFGA